jgi:hypothetical protein
MEKKHIIRFLRDGKRGAYTWLVEMYGELVTSMSVTMAMEIIKEDLDKDSETPVELRYFSLAKAVARFKKKTGKNSKSDAGRKYEFKDANEIKNGQSNAGSFKLEESKSKLVQ